MAPTVLDILYANPAIALDDEPLDADDPDNLLNIFEECGFMLGE